MLPCHARRVQVLKLNNNSISGSFPLQWALPQSLEVREPAAAHAPKYLALLGCTHAHGCYVTVVHGVHSESSAMHKTGSALEQRWHDRACGSVPRWSS